MKVMVLTDQRHRELELLLYPQLLAMQKGDTDLTKKQSGYALAALEDILKARADAISLGSVGRDSNPWNKVILKHVFLDFDQKTATVVSNENTQTLET